MSSFTVGGMLALVFVLAVGAIVLIVIPACVISGRISEREHEADEQVDK